MKRWQDLLREFLASDNGESAIESLLIMTVLILGIVAILPLAYTITMYYYYRNANIIAIPFP